MRRRQRIVSASAMLRFIRTGWALSKAINNTKERVLQCGEIGEASTGICLREGPVVQQNAVITCSAIASLRLSRAGAVAHAMNFATQKLGMSYTVSLRNHTSGPKACTLSNLLSTSH